MATPTGSANSDIVRLLGANSLDQAAALDGVANRTLAVSTTQAGTAADTNETDLWAYSLPANTLSANGKGVRVTVFGVFGATANNKTIKLYFGSAIVMTRGAGAFNGVGWMFTSHVIRTGAATQLVGTVGTIGAQSDTVNGNSAPTETLSGAVTIKATGQNGTAAANDVVFHGAIVETLN